MRIISERAEVICIKELENISKDPFGYRAILIKLSALENKSVDMLRSLIESLNVLFKDTDSKTFIFADRDMLVVYKGMTISILDSIYAEIKKATKLDPLKVTNLFDLEKSLGLVKGICTRKLELIELEKQAVERSTHEAEKEFNSGNNPIKIVLDEKLLSSFAERKSKNLQTKILLIEDDVFSRRLVKNILSKEFDVVEADNGQEALLKYVTHAPNIVFLDINLPDCTGMDLLEKLISIDKRSYVVMLSGNAFKDNILLSIQKGAKGFVGKPFPKEKIFHYIEKYNEEKTGAI